MLGKSIKKRNYFNVSVMPTEWEKRGFKEKDADRHSERMRRPSLRFASVIGALMGFVSFFLSLYIFPTFGPIGGIVFLIAVINLSYLAFYPDVFSRISSGELGFILIDISFFVMGFFVGLVVFLSFPALT